MQTERRLILRTSVGTGERFAGYYEATGEFKMVMQIHNDNDLDLFIEKFDATYVGIESVS